MAFKISLKSTNWISLWASSYFQHLYQFVLFDNIENKAKAIRVKTPGVKIESPVVQPNFRVGDILVLVTFQLR